LFVQFKALVENLFSTTIKTLQIDGGTEFLPIIRTHPQIQFHVSCPYTPQQNGLVERKHRHIVELSLATMFHAQIPLQYWPDVFESVTFIINRLPSAALSFHIPFQCLFQKQPDYQFFKVLGCRCYPYTRPYSSHKLSPRSKPCVFIGYSSIYKGYKCLDLTTNRIYVSRHVIFDETVFPFKDNVSSVSSPTPSISTCSLQLLQFAADPFSSDESSTSVSMPTTPPPLNQSSPGVSLPPIPSVKHVYSRRKHPHSSIQSEVPASFPKSSHSMITRAKSRLPVSSPTVLMVSSTVGSDKDPTTFHQASKELHWRQAMAKELDALAQNNTWNLVPSSEAKNIVGCKWVFKTKRNSAGQLERHKARLVAKGYTQEEGVDYIDTFSPVIKPTTIRLVLTLAVTSNWAIRQLDVNNAFLHGNLTEEIYMAQPPGFVDPQHPDHVCRLNKALYGLRQSPRAWFQKLSTFLSQLGFLASSSDPSLFLYHKGNDLVLLLVYVDDIILTGNNQALLQQFITLLDHQFTIKDLGQLNFFLGIEVHTNDRGLLLTQTGYIQSLLERAKMKEAKAAKTPMAVSPTLSKTEGACMEDPYLFRNIVGALQYVTITRPDIAFAVNRVSQFMHNPSDVHWSTVKRILRYLKGTDQLGLCIQPSNDLTLSAYSDSDWAGCPDDRKSTIGYLVYLGPNLISWCSRKQPTVARSSTEAEYRSLAMASAELVWLKSLLLELGYTVNSSVLWCDNLDATFLAANPAFHASTKHVELDYHFVREKVAAGSIQVRFICSKDQLADTLTKPLSSTRFLYLRDKLNVTFVSMSLRGPISDSIEDTATRKTIQNVQ
jgi:Reverse transcriptase (RNA-dependent DNA polymerase)